MSAVLEGLRSRFGDGRAVLIAALVVLVLDLVVLATHSVDAAAVDLALGREPVATTTAPTTTTTLPVFPPLVGGAPGAVRTPAGIVVPVLEHRPEGALVLTPCANQQIVTGSPIAGAHVVLDPGHGGSEPGAVGPTGLQEGDVNLDVAHRAKVLLEAKGAVVVLTRETDLRVTLATRAALALALKPVAFVSIHHNAAPLGRAPTPGSELYVQNGVAESNRLGGLLWEEYQRHLGPFATDWAVGDGPGVRARVATAGHDFYGVLRRSAGVTAVLSEAAFLSDPAEEARLRDPAFLDAEANAIATAILRLVQTADPGAGFIPTKVSDAPAGRGGGTTGCVDPAL